MTRERKRPSKYAIRVCRWLNHCKACDQPITSGQMYHDGGHGRRFHVSCLPSTDELRRDSPMIPDDSYPIDAECKITIKGGEIRYISLCYGKPEMKAGKPEMKAAYALKHMNHAILRLEREVRRLRELRELVGKLAEIRGEETA